MKLETDSAVGIGIGLLIFFFILKPAGGGGSGGGTGGGSGSGSGGCVGPSCTSPGSGLTVSCDDPNADPVFCAMLNASNDAMSPGQ